MSDNKQIILVTGATGHQGGAVARELLNQGNFEIHALTRDKTKDEAQELKSLGATIVEGDMNDRASLDKALKNVYGVFSVQNFNDGLDSEIRQGKALADAAMDAGVEHFVYASVGGAERNTGIPHFDSKIKIENHIRDIGISHTILRPVFFYFNYNMMMRESIENGVIAQPLSPTTKLEQISEFDYAKMVAIVFKNRKHFLGSAIEVASSKMTMEEVADAFSDALGKQVEYKQISFEEFKKEAGEEMTTMYRWFEKYGYETDFQEIETKFGPTQTLREYLAEKDWVAQSAKA